jgi:uncharacterized membrane protein YphA (DoxX/SURF4 family)
MKILTQISRILTGLLFVFSGFVKGIDPMGTAFKLGDYLIAFRMSFLDDLALPLSITLCLFEFVTGMMLLTGSFVRTASWMAALFMALFTPLSLILALFNPVSDCGCFGDAIHLTNWQTFIKNIIITLIVVFVFIRRNDSRDALSVKAGWSATLTCIILFLLFMWYNLVYLPLVDFRPFSIGTSIPEGMSVPADAPADNYDIKFIYEKDGVQKEFSLNDYPADDTAWKFIDQKSVLVSRGYVPPIHDFTLVNDQGVDITEQVTQYQGWIMLLITRRFDKSDMDGMTKGFDLGLSLQRQGAEFYIVTATPFEQIRVQVAGFKTLFADEITLKTIIRSDPGFVLLHNGTVMAKWSYRSLPAREKFSGDLNSLSLGTCSGRNNILVYVTAILAVSLIIGLTLPFRSSDGQKRMNMSKT